MRISDWSSDVCSSDLLGEGDENAELALAAAVESQSEHPIAHGIVAEAKDRGLNWSKASDVRNITGEGIVANVGGEDIRIVSPGHLARTSEEISDPRLKTLESQGKTVVILVRGAAPRPLFALAAHACTPPDKTQTPPKTTDVDSPTPHSP